MLMWLNYSYITVSRLTPDNSAANSSEDIMWRPRRRNCIIIAVIVTTFWLVYYTVELYIVI